MIERLAGRLLETGEGEVLIDVGGIGFRLQVPSGTASRLPAPGDEVRLTVRMLLHREETVQLYGFGSRRRRASSTSSAGSTASAPRWP